MSNHEINKIEVCSSNTRNDIPIPIMGNYIVQINFGKRLKGVEYLDILLATYNKVVEGSVEIKLSLPSGDKIYKVDCSTIKDNDYLRLDFNKPENLDSLFVDIEPSYSGRDTLAVWANKANICYKACKRTKESIKLDKTPTISIVTPLYKPNFDFLKEAIKSVEDQSYGNWELCLVDDGSNDEILTSYLEKKASSSSKIKLVSYSENKNISYATNKALNELVTGGYYCTLDQDDLIKEDALLKVVQAINNNPSVEFIYTDEDKINESGSYVSPFHKPGWSPTLLTNQMYTCHLSVFKTSKAKEIGGYRSSYDGAQDYDFALRYTKGLKNNQVEHVPEIMYHWRVHKDSTAGGMAAKPESRLNSIRAVSDFLGKDYLVTSGSFQGCIHNKYADHLIKGVSIVIPTKDQIPILKTCLHSIKQSTWRGPVDIFIIDNGSSKESKEFLNNIPDEFIKRDGHSVKIIDTDIPFNFSKLCNIGADQAIFDDIIFLNNDTEVITPDWIERMISHMDREGVGAVGSKLLYPNGTVQHAGVLIGVGGVAGHCHKHIPDGDPGYFGRTHTEHEVSCVTGACLMTTKKVLSDIGGWNEDLPIAFNDVDLCLKMREKGYRIIYTPHAKLYHHESISRGVDKADDPVFNTSIAYMLSRWSTPSYKDPYFNPIFSRKSERYTT